MALLTIAVGFMSLAPIASFSVGTEIDLPDGFMAEGVEVGPSPIVFASSMKARGIQCINTDTGEVWNCWGSTFCAQNENWWNGDDVTNGTDDITGEYCYHNPDDTLNGLAFDPRTNYLWVAGRNRGTLHRFTFADNALVLESSYRLITLGYRTLINDVVVGETAIFATDSLNNLLFKLPIADDGTVAESPIPEYILLGSSSRDQFNFESPFGDNYVPGEAGTWIQAPIINWNGLLALSDGRIMLNQKAIGKVYTLEQDAQSYAIPTEGLGVDFLKDCMHTNASLCPADHSPAVLTEVSLINLADDEGLAQWDGFTWGDSEDTIYGISQPGVDDQGYVYTFSWDAFNNELTATNQIGAGTSQEGLNSMHGPTTLVYKDNALYVANGRFYECGPLPAPPFKSVLHPDGDGIGTENCPGVSYWVSVLDFGQVDSVDSVDSASKTAAMISTVTFLLLWQVFL